MIPLFEEGDVHMKGTKEILLHLPRKPQVLLLGNGVLRLAGGIDWKALLGKLNKRRVSEAVLERIPFGMQPEAMCGTDVEQICRDVAHELGAAQTVCPEQMKRLLALNFDCILTTNYTYDIEHCLLGKWSEYQRKNTFTYYGEGNAPHNNLACAYEIPTITGKHVPVFHVHGDIMRKHSLVLSYYSYVDTINKLSERNRALGNTLQENQLAQKPIQAKTWLDWFLIGDVYSLGFGWDFSEVDLWWAAERKAREHADVGKHTAFLIGEQSMAHTQALLEATGAAAHTFVAQTKGDFASLYDKAIDLIEQSI